MNRVIKYGKYIATLFVIAIIAVAIAIWQHYISPEAVLEIAEADSLVAHSQDALSYNRYQAACDIYEYCGNKQGAVQCDLLLAVVYFGIGQLETCQN